MDVQHCQSHPMALAESAKSFPHGHPPSLHQTIRSRKRILIIIIIIIIITNHHHHQSSPSPDCCASWRGIWESCRAPWCQETDEIPASCGFHQHHHHHHHLHHHITPPVLQSKHYHCILPIAKLFADADRISAHTRNAEERR